MSGVPIPSSDVKADLAPRPTKADSFAWVSRAVVAGVTLMMVVLLGRVAQLQLHPSDALRRQMEPRLSVRPEPKLRGDVTDRVGRVLASTRFGFRIVTDPTQIPEKELDKTIVKLAEAAGLQPDALSERLIRVMDRNRTLAAQDGGSGTVVLAAAGGPEAPPKPKSKPQRYLVLSKLLTDEQAKAVRELKLKGIWLEKQPIREYTGGDQSAPLVGKVGAEAKWTVGLERLLEGQLEGQPGKIDYVRDAAGRPLWLFPGAVQPGTPGKDIKLSIDVEIQRMVWEELDVAVTNQDAAGGRALAMDPATGEILAMVDIVRQPADAVPYPWIDAPKDAKGKPRAAANEPALLPARRYITIKDDPARRIHPALGRNRCIEDVYEPGSTFKPFVWSTIVELKRAGLDEVFDTEGGHWRMPFGRYIEDVTQRPSMTWRDVLVNSSNIGMIKGAARLTPKELHDAVVRFGFGKPTGVGVPGKSFPSEASGLVTALNKWTIYTHSSVPYGHEVAVTPVQMVRAFSAFARNGELAGTLPRLRLTAAGGNLEEGDGVMYRVLPPDVAVLTRNTMAGVVEKMEQGMAQRKEEIPEGGWRYRMFGKSGTAEIPLGKAPDGKKAPRGSKGYFDDQFNSSFIAGAPLEAPRLVVLVVIDDPAHIAGKDRRLRYGSAAAGPVVRRIMERVLTYQGVAPSPKPVDEVPPSR